MKFSFTFCVVHFYTTRGERRREAREKVERDGVRCSAENGVRDYSEGSLGGLRLRGCSEPINFF